MTGARPDLTVIIPCHNVAGYLGDTLTSLRAAGGPGIELIFVDDASTDATGELLAAGVRRLPGATVITNADNLGLAGTRNVGTAAASGGYLSYLDADDIVLPGYFRDLHAAIATLGCDFVRTDHVQLRGRQRTVHRVPFGPRDVVTDPRTAIGPAHRQTSVDYPYAWAGAYHRRLAEAGLLRFRPELRTCEDRDWIWRLHLHGGRFAVVGLLGVLYRREVPTSLTQVLGPTQFDFVPAFDALLAEVEADPEADRFRPKALLSYGAIMCHHLRRRDGYGTHAAELTRRCRAALNRLDEADWALLTGQLDRERRALLHRVARREVTRAA